MELRSGEEGEVARERAGAGGDHTLSNSRQEKGQAAEASGGVGTEEGRGGSGARETADLGQDIQGGAERSPEVGARGAGGEINGGSGVLVTVQNPDYMAHVTGANSGLGSGGHINSGETSRLGPSGNANISKAGQKRSNTEIHTSSKKRCKREVWVLAGRGDKSTGDQDLGNHKGQERREVLDQVEAGKKREPGRGLASNTTETPALKRRC